MDFITYYKQWWLARNQIKRRLPKWSFLLGYTVGPLFNIPTKFLISPPFLRPFLTKVKIKEKIATSDEPVDPKAFKEFCDIWYDGSAELPPSLKKIKLSFAGIKDSKVWFEMFTFKIGQMYLTVPVSFVEYEKESPGVWIVKLKWYHPHMMLGKATVRTQKDHTILEIEVLVLKPFAPLLRGIIYNSLGVYRESLKEQWPIWINSRKR